MWKKSGKTKWKSGIRKRCIRGGKEEGCYEKLPKWKHKVRREEGRA